MALGGAPEGPAPQAAFWTTGRNPNEVLRVIDSLQLTANKKVATPAQWQQGDDVIIPGSVSDDDAKELFPDGWETPLP